MTRPIRHALALFVLALCLALAASPVCARAEAADAAGDATLEEAVKVADPDTSGSWRDLFGTGADGLSFSSEQAGRIWSDESVFATNADIAAAGIDGVELADEDHDFLVSLSLLSSAVSVRQAGGPAHDVVFVVSLNSMLANMSYADIPYTDYLVEALNASIARLMEENEGAATPTRVAVVGYSSEVSVILPLAVWSPDQDGRYLTYQRTESGAGTIEVVASSDTATGADAALGTGSYLQRGISVGAELLAQAPDASSAGRAPELVVMDMDNPPMASTDFTDPPAYRDGSAQDFLGPLPHSRETGYGTDAMFATMLTMEHERQRVNDAYAAGGQKLTVFATALNSTETIAWLLESPAERSQHNLPGRLSDGTEVELSQNLETAVEAYRTAAESSEATVELALFGSTGSGIAEENVTFPVVGGLVAQGGADDLGASDDYYSSRSAAAVAWAFDTSLDEMLGVHYTSPVEAPNGITGTSRITLTDSLGPGMRLERLCGIMYGDTLLDGALAAQAVQRSVNDPWDLDATHEFRYLVRSINARYDLGNDAYALLEDAYRSGQLSYTSDTDFSNRASWYVTADHAMVAQADGTPYTFASQDEIDAASAGGWGAGAAPEVAAKIDAARERGASAVAETYFFIGNLPNQYTGGDTALYDFYVTLETDLATGDQTLYASVPVDAVPGRRASITLEADGGATMALENPADTAPVRILYTARPIPALVELIDRVRAGGSASAEELDAAAGSPLPRDVSARPVLAVSSYTSADGEIDAHTTVTAEAAKTNSFYAFTADAPLYRLSDGVELAEGELPDESQVAPLEELPVPGETYYYRSTVYEADFADEDAVARARTAQVLLPCMVAVPQDQIGTWYKMGADGQAYAAAGAPKKLVAHIAGTHPKDPNATQTAPYVKEVDVENGEQGAIMLSAHLGNNGAFLFAAADDPAGPDEPGGGTTDPDDPGTDKPGEGADPSEPDADGGGSQAGSSGTAPDTEASRGGADGSALAATGDRSIPGFLGTLATVAAAVLAAGAASFAWHRRHP